MTTYLLNTPILTAYGTYTLEGPLDTGQAKKKLADGYLSAIGHQASAEFLGQLLGLTIATNRIKINMQVGDTALVLRIKQRLPEGKVLTRAEMTDLPYELSWLTRIA